MPVANITVNNLKSGYEAEFEGNTVKVIIAGFASDLNNLDASKLTGTIDASGLKEGEHTLALKLDLPDQYSASDTQTGYISYCKEVKKEIKKEIKIAGGKKMARMFGTDGVRGVAGSELTIELATQLGQAGAYVLTKEAGTSADEHCGL